MARPAKNNCDYFPHDAGMRNHKKVKAIRSKFGIMGYGVWSMLIEHLTGNDGNVFEYSDIEFELMSGDFGVSATEIRDVVDYCIKLELLFNKNGFVNSDSLDERLAPVYIKRGVAKDQSAKQRRVNGKFTTDTTVEPVVSVTEIPQSKVKESKVDEINSVVGGKPPTIDERSKLFMEQIAMHLESYPKEMLRSFYDYWTETNPGGRRMRFEMQKVFDIKKRLATWNRNEKKTGNGHSKTEIGSAGTSALVEGFKQRFSEQLKNGSV